MSDCCGGCARTDGYEYEPIAETVRVFCKSKGAFRKLDAPACRKYKSTTQAALEFVRSMKRKSKACT